MAKQQVYTRAEIRFDLYEVLNEMQQHWNDHLAYSVEEGKAHIRPCWVCNMWKERMTGIGEAIRRFGSRICR
ncbi:MAG: hypothetical protein ACLQG3_14530 [Terracidiphilus sp.]